VWTLKGYKKKLSHHLELSNILDKKNMSKLLDKEFALTIVTNIDAWKHSNFMYKNYVLNGLEDTLYDVYNSTNTAKALWESLDWKCKPKDVGLKKS
jgi:hypothetical protein